MKELNQELSPMDIIQKANEVYEETNDIQVGVMVNDVVEMFEVKIKKVFSPVGIKECLQEFIKNIERASKNNKERFGDIQHPYLMYLLIKHFTDLGEHMPNNFELQLESLKQMINSTALFQIIVNFDETEVKKISDELNEMLDTFEVNSDVVSEIKKQYGDKVENKFVLD